MELRWSSAIDIPSYVAGLEQSWSPNTVDIGAGRVELDEIGRHADAYLASLVDRTAAGVRGQTRAVLVCGGLHRGSDP